jgi:hypothetical protein
VRLDRAFYALPDQAASQHYGQFVFDRGWLDPKQAGLLAVVISAPSSLPDAETLATLVAQQLATQTGIQALAQPLWHQIITEKRAHGLVHRASNVQRKPPASQAYGLPAITPMPPIRPRWSLRAQRQSGGATDTRQPETRPLRLTRLQNRLKMPLNAGFCTAIRRSSAESPGLRKRRMTIFAQCSALYGAKMLVQTMPPVCPAWQ